MASQQKGFGNRQIQREVSSPLSSTTLQCTPFPTFLPSVSSKRRKKVSQKTTFHHSCFESHGIACNYINQFCCSTAESFLWERAVVMGYITSSASHVLVLMKCRERTYLIAIKNLLCFHLCSTELTVTARSDHSYLTPLSNEKKITQVDPLGGMTSIHPDRCPTLCKQLNLS